MGQWERRARANARAPGRAVGHGSTSWALTHALAAPGGDDAARLDRLRALVARLVVQAMRHGGQAERLRIGAVLGRVHDKDATSHVRNERRAFAVRLMHLGMDVHFVGETTTPPIGLHEVVAIDI